MGPISTFIKNKYTVPPLISPLALKDPVFCHISHLKKSCLSPAILLKVSQVLTSVLCTWPPILAAAALMSPSVTLMLTVEVVTSRHELCITGSRSCLYTPLVFKRSRSTEPDFMFILLLVFVNLPYEASKVKYLMSNSISLS